MRNFISIRNKNFLRVFTTFGQNNAIVCWAYIDGQHFSRTKSSIIFFKNSTLLLLLLLLFLLLLLSSSNYFTPNYKTLPSNNHFSQLGNLHDLSLS